MPALTMIFPLFLSTLSLRRATRGQNPRPPTDTDFYPRSPCGERPRSAGPWQAGYKDFYPRSPCGERPIMGGVGTTTLRFLSTLSLRRATGRPQSDWTDGAHFYPRSPCGERRRPCESAGQNEQISIHALLAESDGAVRAWAWRTYTFLSTLSLRRATLMVGKPPANSLYFYPRSPCGERPFNMPERSQ